MRNCSVYGPLQGYDNVGSQRSVSGLGGVVMKTVECSVRPTLLERSVLSRRMSYFACVSAENINNVMPTFLYCLCRR